MSALLLYWLCAGFLLLPAEWIVPALGAVAVGLVGMGFALGRAGAEPGAPGRTL